MLEFRSDTLREFQNVAPPEYLFHYTTAQGLIGILKSKEMWATNVSYLNDSKEIIEAAETAALAASNMALQPNVLTDELRLLNEMKEAAGSAGKRFYIIAFSEDGDSLSQWRGYCPANGGYAIGFPSKHLMSVAKEQGFYLLKCCYNERQVYQIMYEIVYSYLEEYRQNRERLISNNQQYRRLIWKFSQYIVSIGAIIKHSAFKDEKEWRIISPRIDEKHERIEFRAGPSTVIPYYRFNLQTSKCPNLAICGDSRLVVRVGPNPNNCLPQTAVQFLLAKYSPGAAHGGSDVPLKNW
jgi:hypothetical protein